MDYSPEAQLRRRIRSQFGNAGNAGGWFMDEEYNFPQVAKAANDIVRAGGRIGVGSHGQLNGLGYHWEMWSIAKGGMSPPDLAVWESELSRASSANFSPLVARA